MAIHLDNIFCLACILHYFSELLWPLEVPEYFLEDGSLWILQRVQPLQWTVRQMYLRNWSEHATVHLPKPGIYKERLRLRGCIESVGDGSAIFQGASWTSQLKRSSTSGLWSVSRVNLRQRTYSSYVPMPRLGRAIPFQWPRWSALSIMLGLKEDRSLPCWWLICGNDWTTVRVVICKDFR